MLEQFTEEEKTAEPGHLDALQGFNESRVSWPRLAILTTVADAIAADAVQPPGDAADDDMPELESVPESQIAPERQLDLDELAVLADASGLGPVWLCEITALALSPDPFAAARFLQECVAASMRQHTVDKEEFDAAYALDRAQWEAASGRRRQGAERIARVEAQLEEVRTARRALAFPSFARTRAANQ